MFNLRRYVAQPARLSLSSVRVAPALARSYASDNKSKENKSFEEKSKNPEDSLEKRDTDYKGYGAEYTPASGRSSDVASSDAAFDPSKTSPESAKADSDELAGSPANKDMSRDYESSNKAQTKEGRENPSGMNRTRGSSASQDVQSGQDEEKYEGLSRRKGTDPLEFTGDRN
ncbi:hypothetical protein YB2330_000615 [Saitoella coloradoensis]